MANIYFSDFFNMDPEVMEEYGLFDVSLINDLPLFVDPFLLFNSENATYQQLHADIITYMRFLKDVTLTSRTSGPQVTSWFRFPEVKQNWLGFSRTGNRGRGLGPDFAASLHRNFKNVFRDFGEETITHGSHLEKLCLVRDGVGRDTISDFTTNLIKGHLAELTEQFAARHLVPVQRQRVSVPKVRFNYQTRSWMSRTFELPFIGDDYVLLTPKDILTKDQAWINRPELLRKLRDIAAALPDKDLRAQVNDYFRRMLPRNANQRETVAAAVNTIEKFPRILDYYIADKEEHGHEAIERSRERVQSVESWFIRQLRTFVAQLLEPGGFYKLRTDTYEDARARLLFLKDVIENKGGHKLFYHKGRPIKREADLHILYALTWYAASADASREVNDGRGPVDFKVSQGSGDKVLIEFKLASNSQLARNLERQTPIYEKASSATHASLKAILYFFDSELHRVRGILKRLKLEHSPHIVLIDARTTNKPSGSRA